MIDPSIRSRRAFLKLLSLLTAFPAATNAWAGPPSGQCQQLDGFKNSLLLQAMTRGVNLPGWDLPERERRPQSRQLEALRGEDFRHIRLPVSNRRLESDTEYPAALHEQIITLISLGFAVSVDLHPDDKVGKLFTKDAERGEAYLNTLWKKMLPVLRGFDPQFVAVELLNEPQIEQDTWVGVAGRLISTVRAVLPEHTIVVGPSGPQRHETLSGMKPFDDRNIVYAVHYYDPMLFTHQGANWGPPTDPFRDIAGLPFPAALTDAPVQALIRDLKAAKKTAALAELQHVLQTPWTDAMISDAFDVMQEWSQRHGCPVIINEFGVLSFTAPRAARLHWLATVNRMARERCLGWAHWDFQDGFGLIDPQTRMPDKGIMKALAAA